MLKWWINFEIRLCCFPRSLLFSRLFPRMHHISFFLFSVCLSHFHTCVRRGAPGVDGNSSDGHAPPRRRLPKARRQPTPPHFHKQARPTGAARLQRQSAGVPGGQQSQTLQNRTGTSNTSGTSSQQHDSFLLERGQMIITAELKQLACGCIHECTLQQ